MKALVTGGAGFIGSHLVDLLLSKGREVVVIDNLATGRRSQVPEKALFLQGDVSDVELLAKALPSCDLVFHLAAVSSIQDSLDRPIEVLNTNLTATLALLEAAVRHKVPRFVFSSSAAVYGDTGGEPAREDMIPKPMSPYAVQKLASEHYCDVYHRLQWPRNCLPALFQRVWSEVARRLPLLRGHRQVHRGNTQRPTHHDFR